MILYYSLLGILLRNVAVGLIALPEDLSRDGNQASGQVGGRLPAMAQLTMREQQVARLVCSGQSNQEIANAAHLNGAMVKKHIHAISPQTRSTQPQPTHRINAVKLLQ